MEDKNILITLDKHRLEYLVSQIDDDYVTLGINIDNAQGDKLIWVSNTQYGDKRVVIK